MPRRPVANASELHQENEMPIYDEGKCVVLRRLFGRPDSPSFHLDLGLFEPASPRHSGPNMLRTKEIGLFLSRQGLIWP